MCFPQFMLNGFREMLNLATVSFLQFLAILEGFFSDKTRKVLWILFATQSWALWVIQNKILIEGKFQRQLANVIFKPLLLFAAVAAPNQV